MTSSEIKRGAFYPRRFEIEYRATPHIWDWSALGAILGLSSGIIAALTGSLLIASSWITGTGGFLSYEQSTGTTLLFLTIPLLILGAHCLDVIERRRESARKSRFDEKS